MVAESVRIQIDLDARTVARLSRTFLDRDAITGISLVHLEGGIGGNCDTSSVPAFHFMPARFVVGAVDDSGNPGATQTERTWQTTDARECRASD